jgi:hypothetical protein
MTVDNQVTTTMMTMMMKRKAGQGTAFNTPERVVKMNRRSCKKLRCHYYVCKVRFHEAHKFYTIIVHRVRLQLGQAAPDSRFVYQGNIVTGSLCPLLYQTCLALAGCTVVATTRFPATAAAATDKRTFDQWKEISGDIRFGFERCYGVGSVYTLSQIRYATEIDILINACQTVKRPRGYYVPMVQKNGVMGKSRTRCTRHLLGAAQRVEKVKSSTHGGSKPAQEGAAAQLQMWGQPGLPSRGYERYNWNRFSFRSTTESYSAASSKRHLLCRSSAIRDEWTFSLCNVTSKLFSRNVGVSDSVLPLLACPT